VAVSYDRRRMTIVEQMDQLVLRRQAGEVDEAEFARQRDALLVAEAAALADLRTLELDEGGSTTAPGAPAPPSIAGIGAYIFDRECGAGGMGTVFLARHRVREGTFAVKVLKPSLAGSHGLRQRFEQEARLGIGLSHPAIVDVVDLVVDGDRMALVMEYVSGETLLDRLRRLGRPLSWPEARDILRPMLQAMAYAHNTGVVHRDLKPGNVLLAADGAVKVTDFGIAHLEGVSGDSTRLVLGTVKYTAPELFTGARPTGRSDVYSMGMTLYRMVAGRLPFPSGAPTGLVMKLKLAELPRPSVFVPDLPPVADRIVELATRTDPMQRPESCRELLAVLDEQEGFVGPTAARPEVGPAPLTGPLKLVATLLPALALLGILVLVGVVVLTARPPEPEDELATAARLLGPVEIPLDPPATPSPAEPTPTEAPGTTSTTATARPTPRPQTSPAPARGTGRTRRTSGPEPGTVLGAEPQESGQLRVTASPGAWIVVGGQRVGHADPAGATVELAPGEHKIRLVCDGDRCSFFDTRSVVERVTVVAGRTTGLSLDFATLDRP
jgi:hypothetical protein